MEKDTLVVLWTTGDKDTAMKMVLMYTRNSKVKGWWNNVTLVIWGASAKLVAEDEEIRAHLAEMAEQGVKLEACKACADMLGVSDSLEALGVDVKYMGLPMTEYLKGNYALLSI